jgi:hypothetical protein
MHEPRSQPPPLARPIRLASPWSRFGAAWLDGLVLKVSEWLLIRWACVEIADALGLDSSEEFVALAVFAAVSLYTLYYGLQLTSRMRGTFSQHLSKFEARDARTGRALTVGQAFGWAFLQAILMPFELVGTFLLLLCYLPILSKPRHQSVFDRICGVMWVRKN